MGDVFRAGHWTALACGAWTLALGWEAPAAAAIAAPVVVVGTGALRRRPRIGTSIVLLAGVLALVAGAPYGAVDTVVPLTIALFVLGRADGHVPAGAVAIVLAALTQALRDGLSADKLVVVLLLNTAPWVFGTVVARRAERARAAVAEAVRLAREDPRVVAAQRAAAARLTLASRAVEALSSAIRDMLEAARDGVATLGADDVRSVHERGAMAVDELRSLLGLLRVDAGPGDAAMPREDTRGVGPSWRSAVVDTAVVLVLAAVAYLTVSAGPQTPAIIVLHAACLGAVALRRVAPGLACLIAAAGSVPAATAAPDVPELMLPGAAAYAMLAWTVAVRSRPSDWAGLAVLTVAGVAASLPHGPHGTGFVLVVLGFGAAAGAAWGERDRILREAGDLATQLRTQLDAAAESAVRAERLRLARDLHDVASHSVGAMVLQAGAAQAQRPRDPERARAALRTVLTLGERALADVGEIDVALGAGDGPSSAGQVGTALERIVAAAVADGQRVEVDLVDLPRTPVLGTTVLRIVAEGLTNAARHAPGARVHVRARPERGRYVVTVRDDGASDVAAPDGRHAGAGYGLAGLAERATAVGGSLHAGPDGDGGFLLEADLPRTATDPATGTTT